MHKFKCHSAVVKIASRCNLNCKYCYMYNLGDETYKSLPKFMSLEVVEVLAQKVKKHCLENDLKEFYFVIHGGEPLLAGIDYLTAFISIIEDHLLPDVIPVFNVQSNATLITEEWCAFFEDRQIDLSISLDGYKEINDANRIYHNGQGSFDHIVDAIKIVMQFENLRERFGILSVINLEADVRKLLKLINDLGVLNVDFLLPNANFVKPPSFKSSFSSTECGDWLIEMFDEWYDKYPELNVRLFTNLIYTLLGSNYSTDAIGEGLNELVVIETDGGIEAVDVLKICGHGFTKEGLNILRDDFDKAFEAPLIKSFITSHESLPDACQECTLSKVCAAGYLPHRFSIDSKFNNPSIYCHDLAKLISHIQTRLLRDSPDELRNLAGIDTYTYEEFLREQKGGIYEFLH